MSEGGEGGADRQKGQPDYPDSAYGRSFSHLCLWCEEGGRSSASYNGIRMDRGRGTWNIW